MTYLLHQLLIEAAEADPNHVGLRCRDTDLTFGELAQRAASLANTLVELGVRPGDRVGILMNKSVEAGIALYGIMMAGAAYVPLDPTAPTSRLDFIIKDCGIDLIISEERKATSLEAIGKSGTEIGAVIGLDSQALPFRTVGWDEVSSDTVPPEVRVMEQDLCYILYTSGSTGVPKGIMHTHRSALAWAEVTADTYAMDSSDVISNYAPLHFDLSTLDMFGGACAMATTVMIPEEHMKLPVSFASLIESERLTQLYTVPMALVQLSQPGVLDGVDITSLRRVLFGGEPMPLKHLAALMRKLPGTRFFNVYGPTEVNGCTHHEVTDPPDPSGPALPIGRPYDNVEIMIVDESGLEVEPQEPGELLVRAPTMMRGYWGRDDLNAKAFFERRRFSGIPELFHRTGDIVHEDADEVIHFHGRKDRQIKTRGYRVELDEVEAVLVSHPSVIEAAVFATQDSQGSASISAAAIVRDDASSRDLVRYLGQTLPAYALPVAIELTREFPRTTSGKIDRRALSAMASGPSQEERS